MTRIDPEPRLPELFDLGKAEHSALFEGLERPWEAVGRIGAYLRTLLSGPYPPGLHSEVPPGSVFGPDVYLGPGCVVEPGVFVKGPAWIGSGCVLRQGLYCRENVLAEKGAVLGHACEIKNSCLLPGAEAPHFNYVGDSILGTRAHLGAGVILSNLRLDKRRVRIRIGYKVVDTGLEKMGALIGDGCQVGCNCVLNPGSILGRGSVLYPLIRWGGVLTENSVLKASPG